MSDTLHPHYQDTLTENYHLFSKYIYADDFVDDLISKTVLSPNDKEIILNQFVNQTRRQRATKLIDVLLTKGPHGYDCFLEILEFQYPHVYREVTKREPRDPPKGAPSNRHSNRLRILENLPDFAHQIKEQYKQNEDLSSQLTVLEGLMKEYQIENSELEKEVETSKTRATEKNKEITTLRTQNEVLQAQVNKLYEDIKNEMERSHQIRDERDDLKQKVQDLIIARDQSLEQKKQGHRFAPVPGRREDHIVEQNKILKEQLEEQMQQSDEYADRITHLQDRETDLESKISKLKSQLRKADKEKEILEKEKTELRKKNETTLERVKQKNEFISSLEDQKRGLEDKIRELGQEKEKLFEKINGLEEELQQTNSELERANLRLSRSSQEMSSSAGEEGLEDGLERRKNVRGSFEKWKGKKNSKVEDSDSDLETNMDSESSAEMMKSNTLPVSGKFNSPEAIFQQEVAHFRWTLREKKPKRVVVPESMEVEVSGSMKRKVHLPGDRKYGLPINQNIQPTEYMLQDDVQARVSGPVSHPPGPDDAVENESTDSSDLRPRIPRLSSESEEITAGRANNGPSLPTRKKPPPPSRKPVVPSPVQQENDDKESTVSSELVARNQSADPAAVSLRRAFSEPNSSPDPVRPHGPVRAICVSTELSDFPSHDVYSVLLPRSCSVVKHPGIAASSNLVTVTVKLPILNDKFEIVGGNHTGIFVSKVNRNCEVVAGDQIKEIIYTPNERADPVGTSLQGYTLDEAHRLLTEEFIRPKKEKEVKIRLKKSHPEYESAMKWIVGNGGTGDFFYIRCNYEKRDTNQQQGPKEITLKPGEIFLVRDTRCDQRLWSGYKINEVTGDRAEEETRILNKNWARRKLAAVINRAHSNEEEVDKRHLAFKFKGQVYERVLPMKASVKLPVILFGAERLVEAMMDLISNNLGTQFSVRKPGETTDPESFELYRQDCHSVWKGKLDKISSSQRHIQKIIFLLKITSEDALSSLKSIFGCDFSMTINEDSIKQGICLKEKLGDKGLQIEELCFPELTYKETLLSKFQSCVQSSQDRILWLSSSEMESYVAEKYLTYLGPDLSSVMMSLQHAQSHDFGSDC